ncbi:CHAT domain-containing protein [Sediminihabitans luteus]|uniref:CHAT domain-containing protein n=1 Tax=Sediminihabitans luteus TaxID=1138585 RepID=A0A2M9CZF5_9CELL|nr:CHAT domain-containing protein [Sediminihabitans luteus]PJJ77277.1 CHAT domain-containing protein [Sediminihabitans luteus]GII98727.1 CHAT domain-containing protein [Sediminihabitans luteus]
MAHVPTEELLERLGRARGLNARARVADAAQAFDEVLDALGAAADPAAPDAATLEHDRQTVLVRALAGRAACSLALGGTMDASGTVLDVARDHARRARRPDLEGVVAGQRGMLRVRTGDVAGALTAFDEALALLPDDDVSDQVVLRLNRGSALADAGELERAEADYAEAQELATAAGLTVYAAGALHNLGYVSYLRGDLPAALRAMDAATEITGEQPAAVALRGRAYVLFEAGLVREADAALATAVELLTAEGNEVELADVELDRAQCALGLRRLDDAARLATSAARRFARVDHQVPAVRAGVLAAEVEVERAAQADDPARWDALLAAVQGLVAQAVRLDPRTARSLRVHAELVEAEAYLASGRAEAAQERVRALRPRTRSESLQVRVRLELACARLAFDAGDRRTALRAVRRGQRLLAQHRGHLGSVEGVTASARHGVHLGRLDVERAFDAGRARAVFDALERGRATFAGLGSVSPHPDPVAAGMLASARRALEEAREIGPDASPDDAARRLELVAAARRDEDAARLRSLHRAGDGGVPAPASARDVAERLRAGGSDLVVVSLAVHDGAVHAVRVGARGARLVRLAPIDEVRERVLRVRSDLAHVANGLLPVEMRRAVRASLRRSLAALDDTLLVPLDVPGALHVVARGDLLGVPWSSLPSRAGLRTSVNSWVDATLLDASSLVDPLVDGAAGGAPSDHGGVLALAGPGLRCAEEEVERVAARWPGAEVLAGDAATCAAATEGVAGRAVVHVAAHGSHEEDNPLFSSIRLADGPLFAHELEQVPLRGSVVVLSACETGAVTTRVGGEVLGLTQVLLRLGARAVVSALAPLSDAEALELMPALHESLRRTGSPEVALADALALAQDPVPLVCFAPVVR